MRVFFDVVGDERKLYDYHGHFCPTQDHVLARAQLIALDLGSSETDDWIGAQIKAKNSRGEILASIPVVFAS
jgi:hypothetical protein